MVFFFFFNDTATTEIYTLSLHDALPISIAELPLALQIDTLERQDKTILDRAWFQTWIQGRTRQERAAFRFRTEQSSVFIKMPLPVSENQVEILLDGYPVAAEQDQPDRLAIPVASGKQRQMHTLEIRFHRPHGSTPATTRFEKLRINVARLECRQTNALIFWQLVLPRNLHSTGNPENFSSESWLGWKGYRWGRQPTKSQSYLEHWVGATSAPPPSPLVNQYLYSAFEVPQTIEAVVVSQSWLIFISVTCAFCLGLLLLYTTLGRRGAFWLGLSIVLLAVVSSYPEFTMLIIESILVGGVLMLITVALRRVLVGAEEHPTPAVTGSSDVVTRAATTEPWHHPLRHDSEAEQAATPALQAGEPAS